MSERLEQVNRLVGKGFLLKGDGSGLQELDAVTIEEFRHTGEGSGTASPKKKVRVWFEPGLYDVLHGDGTGARVFSVAAVGRLLDGTLRRADVPDIRLESHSQGTGSRVIYSDPPR